jgi:hypothetical protein
VRCQDAQETDEHTRSPTQMLDPAFMRALLVFAKPKLPISSPQDLVNILGRTDDIFSVTVVVSAKNSSGGCS